MHCVTIQSILILTPYSTPHSYSSSTTPEEVAALDASGGITRKLQDAVRKDTVTIPDGGYTIIRFTADNPGGVIFMYVTNFSVPYSRSQKYYS